MVIAIGRGFSVGVVTVVIGW